MNNKSKERRAYKSRITRRIVLEYLLTLVVFITVVAFLMLFGWMISSKIEWNRNGLLYIILNFVQEYIIAFTGIFLFIGWALITYYFMMKPLRYLDDVISASEKLVNLSGEQIILPDDLKRVQDELNAVRESAIQNDRIAKVAEQRKNDLIMYLAHDLKTPLSSVIGYLTLLRDEGEISPELREKYLSISLEKAERLEELINEFFEIARFNLSNITLEYSSVNLTRLLEQLTFEFKPMFLEKNLTCDLSIAPDLMIKCDVNKMQRVFDNLLRNAFNYSFENTAIHIVVTRNENHLTITFINTGNTIPKDKLERIFEQFYRLDASRSSKSGGAGLGLAIAKEIVELHGGTLIARSENEVIEFEVTIPLS